MPTSVKKPKFNHDLLIHSVDRAMARALYPTLADALYHPELIEYFKQFDDQANRAKRKSRKLGTLAILLGGAAIAMAAIDVAIRVFWDKDIAILLFVGLIAAVCGLCSAALGAFGTLFGPRKHEWLINRFMGERIRQFHFQSLITQLPLIVAMASNGTDKATELKARSEAEPGEKSRRPQSDPANAFMDDRHRRFVAFQTAFDELPREANFGVTVGPGGETAWRLCKPDNPASGPKSHPALQTFFEAYRDLRLQHQLDYANYKLTSDHRIISDMPQRQSELLVSITKFGIQFVIVVHLCVVLIIVISLVGRLLGYQTVFDAETVITGIFAFAIIALAVVSLCAHAFAQGLQPEREVERYQQYGSVINSILADFNGTEDATEKIKIMWQMERAAFIEMRNFFITHHERSSFAI